MRDPNRIPALLQELQQLWQKHPDLRLGQLVANIVGDDSQVFNCEDERFLKRLREFDTRLPAAAAR